MTTEAQLLFELRKEARKRVTKQLDGLYRTFGRMDREELGAMLDGAQEAVMDWLPPDRKEGGR